MMCRRASLAFGLVLVLASPGRPDESQVKADEEAVRHAGLSTEGPALVEFFRKRTPGDKTWQNIATLVRHLGHKRYPIREKACRELIDIGPPALGLLKRALRSRDLEVARRAERCVEAIEKSVQPDLTAAAVRLLAQRKPPQATATLLNYLPFASREEVADDIIAALVVLGVKDGKPDEAILAAVKDKVAIKRAAAGEVLARSGGVKGRLRVRPLLVDADLEVRLRVALALVDLKEKEAVGVLIETLPALSRDQVGRVEPVLAALAGDKAPDADAGSSDEARRKYAAAWAGWWQKNGETLDLARVDTARRMLGLTLIVQIDNRGRRVGGGRVITVAGRVFEVGSDGKRRWEITDLNYPISAQVVGPNRVLITEYRSRQVTERTFKGEIVWQKQLTTYPTGARRLANGHTLINTRAQVIEVDRSGREVFTYHSPVGAIVAAGRTRTGETVVIDYTGACLRLDRSGREVKRFGVGQVFSGIGMHIDVLPSGNVIIPQYNLNKIVEYDANGRQVWQVTTQQPTSAVRLPNGNTLVASRYTRIVQELDKSGKQVWRYQGDMAIVLHASRR